MKTVCLSAPCPPTKTKTEASADVVFFFTKKTLRSRYLRWCRYILNQTLVNLHFFFYHQLFKLLQTPLLAVVEAVTGFRAVSLVRGLLMLGVTGGMCVY
jgi:hypothetical protein